MADTDPRPVPAPRPHPTPAPRPKPNTEKLKALRERFADDPEMLKFLDALLHLFGG